MVRWSRTDTWLLGIPERTTSPPTSMNLPWTGTTGLHPIIATRNSKVGIPEDEVMYHKSLNSLTDKSLLDNVGSIFLDDLGFEKDQFYRASPVLLPSTAFTLFAVSGSSPKPLYYRAPHGSERVDTNNSEASDNSGDRPFTLRIDTTVKTDEDTSSIIPIQPSSTPSIISSQLRSVDLNAEDDALTGTGEQFQTPAISPSPKSSTQSSSHDSSGDTIESTSQSGGSDQDPLGSYDLLSKCGNQQAPIRGYNYKVTKRSSVKRSKDSNNYSAAIALISSPSANDTIDDTIHRHEFPDFFYVHDPTRYAIYAWNCSRNHKRHYDFFDRNLDYHFRAGHFHNEFGNPEAAIAAYWRAYNASPDTSNTGKPEYKELHYKTKLEALWGKLVIEMPQCLGHGSHIPYSVKAKILPYQVPDRNSRPKQLDTTILPVSINVTGVPAPEPAEPAPENTSIDVGSTAVPSSSLDQRSTTLETLNALLSEMQQKADAKWSEITNDLLRCQSLIGMHGQGSVNGTIMGPYNGDNDSATQSSSNDQLRTASNQSVTTTADSRETASALKPGGTLIPATSVTSYADFAKCLDAFLDDVLISSSEI